jgi:hypothetical protein
VKYWWYASKGTLFQGISSGQIRSELLQSIDGAASQFVEKGVTPTFRAPVLREESRWLFWFDSRGILRFARMPQAVSDDDQTNASANVSGTVAFGSRNAISALDIQFKGKR